MRKNSSGFFILSRIRLLTLAGVLLLGTLAAQFDPGRSQGAQGDRPTHGAEKAVIELVSEQRLLMPTLEPTPAADAPKPAAAKQPKPRPASKRAAPAPELIGTVGYAVAGGNCVNEPGINNPGYGNPSGWPVASQEPWIGATAVFTWNHVGVVTGIWRNGDIEVRHQNYWGGQHRFPRSMIRGFR
ncbi:MAG: CHAP domain-containing protein [bacterium]|nr:CHAP domain-containing protein [bacterium]